MSTYINVDIQETAEFTGSGSNSAYNANLVVNPSITTISSANNYYYTFLARPSTTGISTGSAYTLYIEGAPSGTITNSYALYVNSGLSYLKSLTTEGIYTASGGITSTNGQTVNVGTSGTSSPLNVYGLLSANAGINILNGYTLNIGTSGTSSTLNIYGITRAYSDITLSNGKLLNVGTSGTTSTLNVYGKIFSYSTLSITGTGNILPENSSLYINSASTTLTADNKYYFTYFDAPITSGSTTGSAYTVYIAGAPSGIIADTYSLYVNSGITRLHRLIINNDTISYGNITINDGKILRVGTTGASSSLIVYGAITSSGYTAIDGSIVNIGTTGTTSILNVHGIATIYGGLTSVNGQIVNIGTSGISSTLNVYGIINATNITTFNGSTVLIGESGSSSALKVYGTVDIYDRLTIGTPTNNSTIYIYGDTYSTGSNKFTSAGNINPVNSSLYIAPSITEISDLNSYYYSYYAQPNSTGTTLGVGYTIYIENAPVGNFGATYALYVENGLSQFASLLVSDLFTAAGGINIENGKSLNVGSSGTETPSNLYGNVSIYGSLTTASDQPVNIGTSGNTTSLNVHGPITSYGGINIANGQVTNIGSSGTSSQLNLYGLFNIYGGINTANDQTVNIGSYGDSTPLNVYGVITSYGGLTVTDGHTSSIGTTGTSSALKVYGIITSYGGLNIADEQITNIGTTGTSSELNVYGKTRSYGSAILLNTGSILPSDATLYVAPSITTLTDSNNYYFSYFAIPETTNSTTGNGYTVYIDGAPNGSFSNKYALYVATGNTNIHSLTSRGNILAKAGITVENNQITNIGTSGTTTPLTVYGQITSYGGIVVADGQLVSIGLYANTSALAVYGIITSYGGLTITNDQTLNVGTSGTTSTLNVYGIIKTNVGITTENGSVVNIGESDTLSSLNVHGLTTTAGLVSLDGFTVSIGTTGTSSELIVYGSLTAHQLELNTPLPPSSGGTGTTTSTGIGSVVLSISPTLTMPDIGDATGTSLQLTNLSSNSAIATDSSKNLISITNTGVGNNVLSTSPIITNMSANNTKILNLAMPTNASDAATKAYVDATAQSLNIKMPVNVATTDPGDLNISFTEGNIVDGIELLNGYRILIKNQTNMVENGIYIVNTSGPPTRDATLNVGSFAKGIYILVQSGSMNSGTSYVCTNTTGNDVIGTNELIFVAFSSQVMVNAGTGLTKNGNTFTVDSSQQQITELGTITTGTWNASIIPVLYGGTGTNTSTGSGSIVFSNAPTLVTPNIGNAAGINLNLSGLNASQAVATDASKNLVSIATTGTGNYVLANSPTLVSPNIGIAQGTSLSLTNPLPIASGGTGTALSTGTGSNVLSISPTLTTPNIGNATAISMKITGLTASNAVATDSSKNLISIPNTGSGNNVLSNSPTFTGPVTFINKIIAESLELVNPIAVVYGGTGTITSTGSGSNVLNTSPTLVTPNIGSATGTDLNLSSLSASQAVATDATKKLISVTTTGTGSYVLNTSPVFITPILGVASATSLSLTNPLAVSNGGTGTTSSTGTGSIVLSISPALTTPDIGAATGTSLRLSSLTASRALATDANNNLVSVSTTGSGNYVLATSPILITPDIGLATGTNLQLRNLVASSAIFTDSEKNMISVSNTGTGNNVLANSPTFTGTIIFSAASGTSITLANALEVTSGGTGTTTSTGSGSVVLNVSPTLVTPNIGSAIGASLRLSSLLPSQTVATDSFNNLISVDTTGTGDYVLATSPSLITPNIGNAVGNSLTLNTPLAPSSGGTGQNSLDMVIVGKASNLANGAAGEIPYQTAVGLTEFITSGPFGSILTSNGPGEAPTFQVHALTDLETDITGTLSVAHGGTGVTTSTGTGSVVLSDMPNLVEPNIGVATGTSLTLSIPLAVANGGTGATTSTGSGALVLSTSPTLISPNIGSAVADNLQITGLTASFAVATDATKNLISIQNTGSGNNVLSNSPTFTGTIQYNNATGNSLTLTNALSESSGGTGVTSLASATVGKAWNIAGGTANFMVYQNKANGTDFIDPSIAGYGLTSNGPDAPPSFKPIISTTTTNISGGTMNYIVYQMAQGITSFISPQLDGYILTSNGLDAPPSFKAPAATNLSTNVTNILSVVNGGTGASSLSAITVGKATAIAGGIANYVVYQTASGVTGFINPSIAGYILTSNGDGLAPTFQPKAKVNLLNDVEQILQISNGGIGTNYLEPHEIILGNGSNTVTSIPTGLIGYVLTSNGANMSPSFQSLNVNLASNVNGVLSINNGGTGHQSLDAVTVGKATSIAGGTANYILYQSAANSTDFINPSTAGYALISNGTNAPPTFQKIIVNKSTNVAGGTANYIVYQSSADNTAFISPSTAGYILTSNGLGAPPTFQQPALVSLTSGVSGVLGPAHGGTGQTSLDNLLVGKATNINGGAANYILYQTDVDNTGFIYPAAAGYVLTSNGDGFAPTFQAKAHINLYNEVNGLLSIENGGTGVSIIPQYEIVIGNGAAAISTISNGNSGYVLMSNGVGAAPTFQQMPLVNLESAITGTLPPANGGTGQTSLSAVTVGKASAIDGGLANYIVYQSDVGNTGFINPSTAGYALISNGVSAPPTFQKIIAESSSNILGGTANYILYQSAIDTTDFIDPLAAGYILTSNGPGMPPSFKAPEAIDLETDISGILPITNGGTGASSLSAITVGKATAVVGSMVNYILYQSGIDSTGFISPSTAGYTLISNGPGTAPSFQKPAAISLTNDVVDLLSVSNGGTGTNSIPQYEIVMGNGIASFSGISPSVSGYILTSNGPSASPTFQQPALVSLVSGISDVLAPVHGGTGQTSLDAVTVGKATAIAGGNANYIVYQSAAGITGFINPSNAGYALTSNGTGLPPTFKPIVATTTTNISGGNANQLVYQSAADTTGFISPSTAGYILTSSGLGSPPTFQAPALVNLATGVTNILPITSGGTGASSLSAVTVGKATNISGGVSNQIVYQSSTDTTDFINPSSAGYILTSNGPNAAPTFKQMTPINLAVDISGVLSPAHGGTGQTSLSAVIVGSATNIEGGNSNHIVYQSSTNTTGFIDPLLEGYILTSHGPNLPPTFQLYPNVDLSTKVTGILSVLNGGTGVSSSTGSGSVVLSNSPTLTTPNIGSATGTSLHLGGLTALQAVATDADKNLISVATTGIGNYVLANMPKISDLDVNNTNIKNVLNPINSSDAANKYYVDSMVGGIIVKESVKAATVISGILITDFAAGSIIDGVTLIQNDRILIKDQIDSIENGIYIVNSTGAPTRADDLLDNSSAARIYVFITNGIVNLQTGWSCTNMAGNDTVGTDALLFTQYSSSTIVIAGEGLTKTVNTLSVNPLQPQITTVGTITEGTWNGNTIDVAYGGTGTTTSTGLGSLVLSTSAVLVTPNIGDAVGSSLQLSGLISSYAVATDANKNLISVATTGSGNYVLNNSPVLISPSLGNATANSLTLSSALPISSGGTGQTSLSAVTVGKATSVAGGTANYILYQSAQDVTEFISPSTAGFALISNGTGLAPSFQSIVATSTTNITGGLPNQIVYQSNTGVTGFISPSTAGYILTSNGVGAAPTFQQPASVNLVSGVSGTLAPANGGTGQTMLSAVTVGKASAIAGGTANYIAYQSAADTTGFISPASAGYILTSNGIGAAPSFQQIALINLINGVSGTLSVANGGTGVNTIDQYSIIMGNGSDAVLSISPSLSGYVLTSNGVGAPPTFQQPALVNLTTGISGTLAPAHGGTGQTSLSAVTVGKASAVVGGMANYLLYQSGVDTTDFISPSTAGYVLVSNGLNAPPTFQSIIAPIAYNISGGTANNIVYQSATNTTGFISPLTAGYILTSNGPGAPPSFQAPISIDLTTKVSGILPVANGGTGASSLSVITVGKASAIAGGTANSVVYQSATNTTGFISPVTAGYILTSNGVGAAPTFQQPALVSLTTGISGTLSVANGGTGATSLTQYNIVMGNGTNSLSSISPSSAGYVLTSNGVGAAPTFQQLALVSLTAGISGVLSPAHGGTGQTSLAAVTVGKATAVAGGSANNIVYQTATDSTGFISPSFAGYGLISNGTGAAPSFQPIVAVTSTNVSGGTANSIVYQSAVGTTGFINAAISGYVLTSNGVGIAPTFQQPALVSLTTGISGTLAPANGGTGQTSLSAVTVGKATAINGGTANYMVYQSAVDTTGFISPSTAGYGLISNGTGSAPSFQPIAAVTSTNVSGGTANSIVYQSAVGTTGFINPQQSGYILTSNGASAAPTFQPKNVQQPTVYILTSGTTYTPTSTSVIWIKVTVIGGGGGSGGGPTSPTNMFPGGGGGGAVVQAYLPYAASYTYSVGAAGTAGATGGNGGNGGTTTFAISTNFVLTANGGRGSTGNGSTIGGAGGTVGTIGASVVGALSASGQPGGVGAQYHNSGGNSGLGFGTGGRSTVLSTSYTGNSGAGYGAGASGPGRNNVGAAGTTGAIIIEEFYQ